jgi:hypothetical protein
MKNPADNTPGAGDDLSLIFAAAFQLDDAEMRSSILESLESWIVRQEPYFGEDEIRDYLDRQQGTAMEPFELNDQDSKIAAMATRLAFCRLGIGKTRFRIVSRETLGVTGGVVLTDNLRSFFIERYSRGEKRSISDRTWYVAPAEIAQPEVRSSSAQRSTRKIPGITKRRGQPRVTFQFDHHGLHLQISNLRCQQFSDRRTIYLAPLFQEFGRILDGNQVDRGRSLNKVGLRVTNANGQVRISTGSPESILRFTAMADEGRILELPTSREGTPGGRLFIRLRDVDDDNRTLQCVNTVSAFSPISPFSGTWMKLNAAGTVALSPSQQLAISRWLAPHDSWITSNLLEKLI